MRTRLFIILLGCMLLHGCGNTQKEYDAETPTSNVSAEDISNTTKVVEDESIIEAIEEDESTVTESIVTIDDFDPEWYVERFYRGSVDSKHILWIDDRFEEEKGLAINGTTSVISSFNKDSVSFYEDENGQFAHYSYEWTDSMGVPEIVTLDYYPEKDMILLYMTASPFTGQKYDYSDLYFFDAEYTETNAPFIREIKEQNKNINVVQESTNVLLGRRFECFESNGAGDVILQIIGVSEDGGYSCELDGITFFIAQRDIRSDEYVEFALYEPNGSVGTMYYYTYEDKLCIEAYDEMVQYCGEYIGLPDCGEE